jgi:uncharacterized membrane protein YqjE
MDNSTAVAHGPGLFAGITSLARNAAGLVMARFELAALELGEVRNHLIELVVMFAIAALSALFALAFGCAVIVALAWEALGWKILLIMFLVFVVLAVGLVLKGVAMLKQGRLAFPETMNQLKHDREALL